MASESYYRSEAQRCRVLAAASPDPEAARRWHSIAADYEKLAQAFSEIPQAAYAPPVQRQPMQQQQSKSKPEDKT